MKKKPNKRNNFRQIKSSQATTEIYSAVSGRSAPDHELTTFGPSNIVRRFDLDEPSNGPSVVFRHTKALAGFYQGFTASDRSAGDYGAATDTTITDPTTALIGICPMAKYFESDVYPVLDALFASGTGKRYEAIDVNQVVRYISMWAKAYQFLLVPLVINKLVYHTDWTKIAPFSPNVPVYLYQIAKNLDATDVGLAELYLPLMRRMEDLVAFPRVAAEIKRMMSPMMSVDLHGRLMIPVVSDPTTIDSALVTTAVANCLDYITTHLGDCANLMSTFLPFPFREQSPWILPDGPIIDVERDSGWFNSGVASTAPFEDTGDPTIKTEMLCDAAADMNALFYTRHCQPTWSEVKLSSIFYLTNDATDDEFNLITSHAYNNIIIPDDAFDTVVYDGTPQSTSGLSFRYQDYTNCRYAVGTTDYGIQKPGTFGAKLGYDQLRRMMRVETSWIFNLEVLKQVTASMAGASIRELRYTIRGAVYDGIKSPI